MKEIYEWLYDEYAEAALCQEPLFQDHVLEEVLAAAPEDAFVIGGASVYRQLLPWCSTAYVTKIDRAFPADCHFPDLDQDPVWEQAEESAPLEQDGIIYRYLTYRRKK